MTLSRCRYACAWLGVSKLPCHPCWQKFELNLIASGAVCSKELDHMMCFVMKGGGESKLKCYYKQNGSDTPP